MKKSFQGIFFFQRGKKLFLGKKEERRESRSRKEETRESRGEDSILFDAEKVDRIGSDRTFFNLTVESMNVEVFVKSG